MKYYIQYYDKKLNGEIDESLGSDGVFILDGRNNLNTMINDGYEQYNRIKKVRPGLSHFKVMKGERFTRSVPITELIKL